MQISLRKEQFSKAYVHAVASVAGCSILRHDVDDDSVDLTLASTIAGTALQSPRLDIQLKCTELDVVGIDSVRLPISVKNYNDLRTARVAVPRILIVVAVPPAFADWIHHDETQLLLRKCAYWASLRGAAPTTNLEGITFPIPRTQRFDVAALEAIMTRIADGGLP